MFDRLKEIDKKATLWWDYNDVYINKVQKNPRARSNMYNDPGVKFMRKGWWIVGFIIFLLNVIAIFIPQTS